MMQLSTNEIILPDNQLRSMVNEQKMNDLANSIEEVGLLQPLLVMEKGDKYLLVAGMRRFMACKKLNIQVVSALVLSADVSIRQIQVVENIQREDLNPVDRACAIMLFMEENGYNITEASKRLGIPRTTLNDWMLVIDLDEKYQQAVINNYYGGSSSLTISHVALAKRYANKLGSPKLVDVVLDAVLYYGLDRAETRKILNLTGNARNMSIEDAIRHVRLTPIKRDERQADSEWDVEQLVTSIAKTGGYLVKTNSDKLRGLNDIQRIALTRQAKALHKLLDEVLAEIEAPIHDLKKPN